MRLLLIAAAAATLFAADKPGAKPVDKPVGKPLDRAWSILDQGAVDENTGRRAKALRALGLIPNNAKAVKMAEKSLADPKPEVQAAAASALGQMGSKSSVPKLIEVVRSTKSTLVAFEAASAVYVLGDPQAYSFYYAILTGQRKSGEGLIESQTKMLKDPKALANMGFEAGLGFVPFGSLGYGVFKTLTKDDTSPVRAAAAQKLVNDPDPKTVDALMTAAADPKWLVRAAVINAIAKRDDATFLKALVPRLDDENETVRFSAAGTVIRLSK